MCSFGWDPDTTQQHDSHEFYTKFIDALILSASVEPSPSSDEIKLQPSTPEFNLRSLLTGTQAHRIVDPTGQVCGIELADTTFTTIPVFIKDKTSLDDSLNECFIKSQPLVDYTRMPGAHKLDQLKTLPPVLAFNQLVCYHLNIYLHNIMVECIVFFVL